MYMEVQAKYLVEIKGTRPLMMHSPNGIGIKTPKQTEYDPEVEAKKCLYLNSAGKICVPGLAILSSIRKSATNETKAGAGKKTLKEFVFSGLGIAEDMIVLPNQKYEVDTRPVVVQRARILRSRPVFDEWSLKFNILVYDKATWGPGTLRRILASAGDYQGLLDFRPLFGTFEVVSMKDEAGREVK